MQLEQREKSHPSTQHSNLGGWQSSWDMDRWGGAPAIELMAVVSGGGTGAAAVITNAERMAPDLSVRWAGAV